ncbi:MULTISPECIES: hypothetical protein [unclassified Bradyrhizobium]|uniref:hypothetical protein n=1 Tax=unclassified Bradyrhizobium TaxID=2631580 RepID=UPI0028EBB4FE|nr:MULTISPECIES: hypothetical protein [unclassified Bradyrhizobium]
MSVITVIAFATWATGVTTPVGLTATGGAGRRGRLCRRHLLMRGVAGSAGDGWFLSDRLARRVDLNRGQKVGGGGLLRCCGRGAEQGE